LREWSNGAVLLGRLALVALIAAPFMYWFYNILGGAAGAAFGFILVMPLAAKLVTRQLIELFHEGFTWLSQQPLKQWEGAFYAFDDVQVRIYEVDGELWFAVPDILRAIDLKALPPAFAATHRDDLKRVPGSRLQALPASGLPALLEPLRQPKAGRFLVWAQREVVAPWQRRHGATRFGGAAKT
jgi:hypothetical protein